MNYNITVNREGNFMTNGVPFPRLPRRIDSFGIAGQTSLHAYSIDGNNYLKLRDIAKAFSFDVDWRDSKAWIELDGSPKTQQQMLG